MTPPKNVSSFNVPPRVMMDHAKIDKKTEEMLENIKNLVGTEAGTKATELDKTDGKIDGKISASVWNNYVKELFDTPEEAEKHFVQNEIDIVDAMNSITTYKSKLQANSKKPDMGLNGPAEPQAAEEPEATPEVQSQPSPKYDYTSQVEDDGKRHYYKKLSTEGEDGYKEISEDEYRSYFKSDESENA